MQRRIRDHAGLAVVLVACTACAGTDATSVSAPLEAAALAFAAAPGPLRLAQLLRSWPGEPCATGRYRDFDFWVGDWDVFNAAGARAGTNRIEVLMDGCVVAEHWVAANGLAGRSINTYDRDTGMWHQTWLSANPIGHIRMGGGLQNGIMVMDGIRRGATFTLVDHYEWEQIEPDVVVQSGFRDVPELDLHFPFALTYRRTPDLQPVPTVETAFCQAGGPAEASRLADFLVGSWRVVAANGPAVGSVEITSDLSGCLFEERFATPKGLRWIGFLYFDHVEGAWYRTSIDTEADRIELRGSLENGILVLEGQEPGPNGVFARVRFSWQSENADRIRHHIQSSTDGGASWRNEADLLLLRD